MTDDIVTRLRVIHCAKDEMTHCGTCLPCQAANEIERLRGIIVNYVKAEEEYEDVRDGNPEIIYFKDEWRLAYSALYNEAFRL
jgi:hypothetical protein